MSRQLPLLIILAVFLSGNPVAGDEETAATPADFKSANFVLHTDLGSEDAEELLTKLEAMLKIVSRYWGAPSRKTIECFVVDNPGNWPVGAFSPQVRGQLEQGGITLAQGVRQGRQFNMTAVVYASSQFGTPLHEAVHAYCYQTFGVTGPTWYAEGMAEMGNYWVDGDSSVNCPEYVIQFLKKSPRPTIEEITDADQQTGDGWRNYAWRWALCHFLVNNPNYQQRFRVLGANLLAGRTGSFERTFRTQKEELEFEFTFFLDHLANGFDVDRCHWNWQSKFREPRSERPISSKILADRGWQPSGAKIVSGTAYAITTEGQWSTSADEPEHGPAGDRQESGKLVATLFDVETLSEPFRLDPSLPFNAQASGQLFLRCEDDWTSLNDNTGQLTVSVGLVNQ